MATFTIKTFSYMVFIYYTIALVCGEPHCSKYHFVESLLEKVVRMEFKLEQMESGYKEMERTLNEERRKLKEDGNTMKELMETASKDTASKLNDMKNEVKLMGDKMLKHVQDATSAMEASRQQNEAKLVRLSADTRKCQNETISNLTNLAKVPDVFFKAKDLASHSVSHNQIFVFKNALHNEGGGYDTGSGIFTAPVGGDYLFTAQMCIERNKYIYYTYTVDDVNQQAMTIGGSKYTCATSTFFARLNTGARVCLKCRFDSNAYQDPNRWNTFSGILLKV